MKKLLLGSSLVMTSAISLAQMSVAPSQTQLSPKTATRISNSIAPSQKASISSPSTSALGDLIFQETFGNGLGGDGSNGAWTTYDNSSNNALWEYRGTSTTPSNAIGSRGGYNGSRGPIASSTTSNGFVIFDSDFLDNNGSDQPQDQGTGASPAPHIGYLESPSIDLSAYNNVVLEFFNYYRKFDNECRVEFSVNGGTSWMGSQIVYDNYNSVINIDNPNNERMYIYFPDGVAGNSNVKFRFIFDGTIGQNPQGYYFWQLDDVSVYEAPDNDLELNTTFFNTHLDSNSRWYHYAEIPEKHADYDSVYLAAEFTNKGKVTQENVKVGVNITGPTNSTLLSTTSIASMPSGQTDSLIAGLYIPNQGQGNYQYDFYITSDSTEDETINDSSTFEFEVTDNVYSWSTNGNTFYRPQVANNSYELCTLFSLHQSDSLTAMSVEFLHDDDNANNPYNLTENGILEFRVIDASQLSSGVYNGTDVAGYSNGSNTFYSIQASDLSERITVPLSPGNTTIVQPGDYYACVKTYNVNAYVESDLHKSDNFNRLGTTIISDDSSPFALFRACPTIKLFTKGSVDPCVGKTISATVTKDESSQANASITATGTGGTSSYQYAWSDPNNSPITGATITGLSIPGIYKLTVTDAFGCQSSEITTNLAGCVGLQDIATSENITFASSSTASDGAIDLTISNGSGNFSFSWTGPNGYTSSSEDINNLSVGQYDITVTDNQCNTLNTNSTHYIYVTNVENIELADRIAAYPIPNEGQFNLELDGLKESVIISVFNTVGQEIYSESIEKSGIVKKSIELPSPQSGIYFLNVEGESGNKSIIKILIQ